MLSLQKNVGRQVVLNGLSNDIAIANAFAIILVQYMFRHVLKPLLK
jgi:hypothetical protein